MRKHASRETAHTPMHRLYRLRGQLPGNPWLYIVQRRQRRDKSCKLRDRELACSKELHYGRKQFIRNRESKPWRLHVRSIPDYKKSRNRRHSQCSNTIYRYKWNEACDHREPRFTALCTSTNCS